MQFPAIVGRILPGEVIHDFPVLSLILANAVTIVLAILGNWDLTTVLFIYWSQSVIIGIFAVISMLGADTAALAADLDKPLKDPGRTQRCSTRHVWLYKSSLAGFFALHYGLFHWVYFSFLVESGIFGPVNFSDPGIWLSCGLFFANHLYSHIRYRHEGPRGTGFIGEEFFSPYQRIIPMHMTIIFGSIVVTALQIFGIESTLPVLVLFLLLKTRSDISAHRIKHAQKEHPDEPVQYL
jgi:hypothetical protein